MTDGSHADWLRARTPVAPPALVACIADLLGAHPEWNALPRAEAFIAATEALLRRVLEAGTSPRACALDLLAADACVTYAFEAAADEPHTIVERAERAKNRIAAIAAASGTNPVLAGPLP